jgi:OFA family oxalate/formate antiporter-like MFS transporter
MLGTIFFWCFFSFGVTVSAGGLMVINSAATIAAVWGAPPALGLIVSVFNGCGRLVFGALFDRFGRRWTMLIDSAAMLLGGLSLYAGAVAGRVLLIVLGLVMIGASYGGIPSLSSAIVRREYGPAHVPVNFSLATCLLIPAAVIGPMLSSSLLDRSGGSFVSTFAAIIAMSVLAFALTFATDRFPARSGERGESVKRHN